MVSPNTLIAKREEFAKLLDLQVVQNFGKYLGTYINEPHQKQDIGKEILQKRKLIRNSEDGNQDYYHKVAI